MIVSKIIPTVKKALFTAAAVVALMQCSEDEMLKPTSVPAASGASAVASNSAATVSSLTVTGSNTTYTTLPDCKTCTYVVAAKEQVVDGKSLGFKPGAIICLNTGIAYGNVEMINLEGTIEKPIVIATIGTPASAATTSGSDADPY